MPEEFNLEKVIKSLEDERQSLAKILKISIDTASTMLSRFKFKEYDSYPLAVVELSKQIFGIEATIDAKKKQANAMAERMKNAPKKPCTNCSSCNKPNTTPIS